MFVSMMKNIIFCGLLMGQKALKKASINSDYLSKFLVEKLSVQKGKVSYNFKARKLEFEQKVGR